MKFSIKKLLSIVSIFTFSCSEETEQSEQLLISQENHSNETQSLVDALTTVPSNSKELNFEKLLNSGENVPTVDVRGVFSDIESPSEISPLPATDNSLRNDLEAEKAFKDLEVNSLEHQKSIENLRKINQKKDQTISSLSVLNDELVLEIRRLKGHDIDNKIVPGKKIISGVNELDSLKGEIKKLKNNLALKSEELKGLRFRNDSLEGRIIDLEKSPSVSSVDLLPNFSRTESGYRDSASLPYTKSSAGGSILQFEAVVTALNGKSKEAFFTEFFILPIDLEDVLRKGGINLSDFPGIDTYSELWARSRKNSFLFPGVHKNIRSLLLNFEENGNGHRIRTDVNGEARVLGLKSGKYFVIGTASLGKVGVTWSVPVLLNSGNNKISLTLANCSWSL